MSFPIFQTEKGLYINCPSARFRGALVENTETEYDGLEWLDERTKPGWADVEQASLDALRGSIITNINKNTAAKIQFDFRASTAPDTPIESTLEWQFDVLNLWLQRDSGLFAYPYDLHCSMSSKAVSSYISIANSSEMDTLYIELFTFINTWLVSGRTEKEKLTAFTKTQLEEYRDLR